MSFYPTNQNSNVFNADDFISPEEVNETTTSTNNEVNMEEYMKKSGSVMSGTLQVPQLFISGANSLAYSTSEKTKVDGNTNKLQNVSKTVSHTEISDLKCNQIQFASASQNQAFTDADKTQIYTNQGKLDGVSNSVGDIITSNKTLNIKDSPEIDVVNTQSSNTKFDGALSFFRTGSIYRKWWIGTLGDTINPQNTFNICVNGNHHEPENIFDLSPQGNLKLKGNIETGKIIANENADINGNLKCTEVHCKSDRNNNLSRFATVNNWLYIQNQERIVFDQIASGTDPNVEINTATGELLCETLIIQNNQNSFDNTLTVNGKALIKNKSGSSNSITMHSDNGTFIEGYSTSLNERQFWIGTSGATGEQLALNIVNHDNDINIIPVNGIVNCQSNFKTQSITIGSENQTSAFTETYKNRIDINKSFIQDLDEKIYEILISNRLTPTGSVMAFAGITPPPGYLLCNGEMVFKSSFPDLYAVISHHYQVEPQNTFNFNLFQLPDLRQSYITGVGINTTASMKYSQPAKELGKFSDMSVQDHAHIQLMANKTGNTSLIAPGSSTILHEKLTQGTYHTDGSLFTEQITQGCNVSMNYIIKY